MNHHTKEVNLPPEEKKFQEYITRGDDFCKIEIYRQAVLWYRRALELKPDDPVAIERYTGCRAKIKGESKAIIAILIVAAVIVAVVLAVL